MPQLLRTLLEREQAQIQAAKAKTAAAEPDQSLVDRYDWKKHARPKQLVPAGEWRFWLIMAGRYFGKTRTGAETARQWAEEKKGSIGALVGETPGEIDGTMVNGPSGIMACSPPWFRPIWVKSTGPGEAGTLTWPNGSVAYGFSASKPQKLRGPQFHWGWGDELAKWPYPTEAYDQLNFSLRLPGFGPPQAVFTTTPRPIPIVKQLLKRDRVVVTRGSTYENEANADPTYIQELLTKYENTRLGRQEINAEVLEDLAGTLWSLDLLEQLRLSDYDWKQLGRIVVAVDPSGGSEEGNDEQGIVVAGKWLDEVKKYDCAVVLEDRSCRLTPGGWGERAVKAAVDYQADCIVAEINFGGEMVKHTIETAAKELGVTTRVKVIHASRAKHVRAEPVSALYEKRRVRHVAGMTQLEDELSQFTPEGYQGKTSPNRADAAVWALTELLVGAVVAPGFGDTKTTPIVTRWGRGR